MGQNGLSDKDRTFQHSVARLSEQRRAKPSRWPAHVGEKLASHFVAATIKHFPAGQAEAARKLIAGG